MKESQKWSYEKLKKYQSERLQNLIHYVYQYVPYYTTVMNSSGIKPEHIKTQEDLVKFPIIKKVDIIKNYDQLQTTHPQIRKKDIVEISTSGSTGTPVKVRMSKKAYQYDYANNWRQRGWYGVKIGDRIASFAGRVIINPDINRGTFWRKNYSFNQTLFSLYHISDETTEKYVKYLQETEFEIYNGYPSFLVLLANYILNNNIDYNKKSLKGIHTSSETLYDSQRECIEEAFKTDISDRYSNAESVCSLAECQAGRYHLNAEDSILEVADIKNNIGKMICTGLNNYIMPLIRYDIGDLIETDSIQCTCKMNSPSYRRIIGREDDVIKTPDNRLIGRLDHIYKGLKNIKRAQIIQEKIDRIVFKIEVFENFSNRDRENLYNNAKLRLGKKMEVSIEIVDKIEMNKSGKFKAVINRLNKK